MKPAKAKTPRKPTRDADGSIITRTETRRTANGKTRKETVFYARVRQNEYDAAGRLIKKHERKRRADSYQDAVILRRRLRLELKSAIENADKEKAASRIYFFDLLDFYEQHYVKEAVYSAGKKIAGQRSSVKLAKQQIQTFRDFFGNVPVAEITYARLFDYKLAKMSERYKIVRNSDLGKLEEWKDRKPATVHRYLARLRRILAVGVQQGYILANPFTFGDPLIDSSVEETRVRTCSFDEEDRLLAVCTGRRSHLADVIVLAVDTFLRRNELFSLVGSDVIFGKRFVTVRERNSKTLKERSVPLTDRAFEVLRRMRNMAADEWDASPVFEMKSVKSAWYSALRAAEIEGLRFHDLRATGITRMLDAGVPAPVVMKYSGHDQYETFLKYVRADLQIIQDAGAAMSEHFAKHKLNLLRGSGPLSKGHEKENEGNDEVTELGETIN